MFHYLNIWNKLLALYLSILVKVFDLFPISFRQHSVFVVNLLIQHILRTQDFLDFIYVKLLTERKSFRLFLFQFKYTKRCVLAVFLHKLIAIIVFVGAKTSVLRVISDQSTHMSLNLEVTLNYISLINLILIFNRTQTRLLHHII